MDYNLYALYYSAKNVQQQYFSWSYATIATCLCLCSYILHEFLSVTVQRYFSLLCFNIANVYI